VTFAPWSDRPSKLDGAEFERVVEEMLTSMGRGLPDFRVERQELIVAPDGQYRIDLSLRFSQFGVSFLVLGECKNHVRPVEREDVQVLADRLRAAGAQKGMLFSTNGFQSGAIQYARVHGIALITVIEGRLTYETRARPTGIRPEPPPWANIPPYVGQLVSASEKEDTITVTVVDRRSAEPLAAFLRGD
jgi:restriction system protein